MFEEQKCTTLICGLALLVLFSIQAWAESLCDKQPRLPPPGCCPKKDSINCAPHVPLCSGSRQKGNTSNRVVFSSTKPLPFIRHPCGRPWQTDACQGGFFLDKLTGTVAPCPPGFYCPELQTFIIPCPLGAYCRQLKKIILPQRKPTGSVCESIGVCCQSETRKETPLYMNITGEYVCPGKSAPDACPKGYFCPNTTTMIICTSGHYCQEGSVQPKSCPLMTTCGEGESAPLKNAAGPLLGVLLVVVFLGAYYIFLYRNSIKFFICLYWGTLTGKDRSFVVSYDVKKGLKGIMLKMATCTEAEKRDNIEPKDFTFDLSFEQLSLTLNSHDHKVVLSGVTGSIKSGQVTAVMGPSGAGKTTFLNALSGKAYYGKIGGIIRVNGESVSNIKQFKGVTGFVPQEDIMHRKLTVKEVLIYQCRLRLPPSVSHERMATKVKQTLELLDISHVMDSQIGDEETRGISGGQRKRVNIGMELVADPTLLFLDEPTSGLDSTSSLSVLGALRAVAEKGRLTVVCVIHQPRYEIFTLFHNLLFLGPGGKTVYQGNVEAAEPYFQSLGYSCPANVNPADFYMDVIGGVYSDNKENYLDELFENWEARQKTDGIDGGGEDQCNSSNNNFIKRPRPGLHKQFWSFLIREIHLQFRNMKSFLLDMLLVLVAGGVLGGLFTEVKLKKVIAMNTSSSLAIGLTSLLASLRCFGNHRTTFWRESASGINRFSYFMAVNVCQLPIILLTPLVYLSLQYTFTAPRALFVYHYLAVLMAQFATSGIGYTISCLMNPMNSQMASVVFVLISSLLSGSMPELCQLNKYTVIGPVAYSLSYSRWFVEALFEKEVIRYPAVLRTQVDYFAYRNDYSLDNYGFCLAVLFIFGIVSRLTAYLLLVFSNRGQQQ